LAAAAQTNGSVPQSFSLAPHYPNQEVGISQSQNENGAQLVDPDVSTDFFEAGDLDVEFSRSFVPEITSVFNEASHSRDNNGHTVPKPLSKQGTTATYQPAPIGIADMTSFVPLSSDEMSMYPAERFEPIDPVQFWAFAMDSSNSSEDSNRIHSIGGNKSNFMARSSNPETFLPGQPITLDPKLVYQTSAVYLNEYGTIDQKKDQLEPFRRLFQLDDTAENNQLITLAVERKHEIKDIMLAGFRAINSRANSSPGAMNLLSPPFLADPYKNNLRLVRVATLDAYLSNALSLGMDIPSLYRDDCPSPFYRPRPDSAEDIRSAVAKMSARIPEHLKPTPPQVLCPHRPYLDLLPFPILRARAIALMSRNPPLINSAELKSDIMNDGLICWRTSGSGTGQPWDMKSWEAAPWFLRKWPVLVGGEEEEVWKQTVWWRELRGEGKISDI
jgi:hypothetical protein